MLARMEQFIYNLGLHLYLHRRYMAPPEVFMKEEWRLEISASAYGELSAANPVQSGTATNVPVVRRVCELHVGKAFGQIHGRVRRRGGGGRDYVSVYGQDF